MKTLLRRDFLRLAAIAPIAYAPLLHASDASPEIAFTFDDPKVDSTARLRWQDINDRMLQALAVRKLQATLFVCGKRIDHPEGKDLIAQWGRAGHAIANHSYSHLYFNARGSPGSDANVTLAEFEADALKNEPLIANCTHFKRLFRFPFFKEGDTISKRDGMRQFLKEHNYRIGRATPSMPPTGPSAPASNCALKKTPTPSSLPIAISSCSTSGTAPTTMTRSPGAYLAARLATPFSSTTTR